MKLWLKVFIAVFLLVSISLSVTTLMVVSQNRAVAIENEVNNNLSFQDKLLEEIVFEAKSKKQEAPLQLLSDSAVADIIKEKLVQNSSEGKGFAVLSNNDIVYSTVDGFNFADAEYGKVVIQSQNDKTLLTSAVAVKLEGTEYSFWFEYDLTPLYDGWEQSLYKLQVINYSITFVVALIILLLTYYFLSPLSNINSALNEIAKGKIDLRIKEKGSGELRTLTKNINTTVDALEKRTNQLQLLSDGRKQFIDNFSHEMKTPLTSIIGFSNLLLNLNDIPEEKRMEYAKVIEKEAERLKTLSEKLLQLTTAEHISLELQELKAGELFEEVSVAIKPLLKTKELEFSVSCDDTFLCIDKELFISLLYNLIDNAVKASDIGGRIYLDCTSANGTKTVTVTDEGIGMSEEEISRVTEPFYMADKARSRKNNGAGLGLTLCAKIAKQHGANLQINSEKGKGTSVSVIWKEGQE